jgi:Cdc6-like AAA superfamily ATPase
MSSETLSNWVDLTKWNQFRSPRRKQKKSPTIESCLVKLNETPFSIQLPGREDKVAQIRELIEQSFTGEKWQMLLISGSPDTVKPEMVKQCIGVSIRPSHTEFVNCKSDKPMLISSEESDPTRLLILDELEFLPNFRQVLINCQKFRCSLISISNSHDETLAIAKSGRSNAISIVFKSYRSDELFQIMAERIGGLNNHISQETLLFVAKTIGKDHGDTREALSALNFILAEAVRHRTARIGTPTAQMEKKLVSCLQNFVKQMQVLIEMNVVDIFGRLEAYGFIGK